MCEVIRMVPPMKFSLSDLNQQCSIASGILWGCKGYLYLEEWKTSAQPVFELLGTSRYLKKVVKYLISKGWKKEGL